MEETTMSQTLHLIVDGQSYLVEVDDLTTSPLTVRVNGKPFSVEWASEDVDASVRSGAASVYGASRPVVSPNGSEVKEVTAPMPGNILDIAVKPGDRVTYKQRLCNLEAMKMKNALRSAREGVIAAVHVREGQAVAYGDLLFTFE
jgi:biotin carboxyl carrier protein